MGKRRKLNNQNKTKGVITVNPYYLDPSGAGIVEGVVSDAVALSNKDIMNSELALAVAASATTFVIPAMDAYFNTNTRTDQSFNRTNMSTQGIILPSNLNIQMQPTTYLRCQPNDRVAYNLFSIWDVDNITISGGNLVGDKYTHVYNQDYTVTTAASTTEAIIKLQREYVITLYNIPVTVSNATTNAAEIASYLDALPDMSATSSGAVISIVPNAGLYVEIDDDSTDLSGINFSSGHTHEFGFLFSLYSSTNIVIDNVNQDDPTGDAVFVGIKGLRNTDGTVTPPLRVSTGITVKNCTISGSRRNNISPVDCNGMIVENNIIKDAAKDIRTLPASNMDLESYRIRNGDGSLSEYARVENVIIRNNTFSGADNADIILYTCNDVEVYGNTFTKNISNTAAFNISIHDNIWNCAVDYIGSAISLNQNTIAVTGEDLCYHYDVYNNTVNGSQSGISVDVNDARIYNNDVLEFSSQGMLIGGNESHYYDNILTSTLANTYGFRSATSANSRTNVLAERITTNVTISGLRINNLTGLDTGLLIDDCDFIGGLYDVQIATSSNITISNSRYTTVSDTGNTNVTIP
jgi:hypothetical protein